jgi:hypothetical protein
VDSAHLTRAVDDDGGWKPVKLLQHRQFPGRFFLTVVGAKGYRPAAGYIDTGYGALGENR